MRILIASDTYYPQVNGCSYFTQRLVQGLVGRGHTVAVVAPGESYHNVVSQHDGATLYAVSSIPVPFYPKFRISLAWLNRSFVQEAVTTFKPDVVHLQGHFFISAEVLRAANTLRVPMVATNHFMPENILHYAPLPKFAREYLRRRMWRDFKKVFDAVGAVTTPTETAAALIRDKTTNTVAAISCGIDAVRFNPGNSGDVITKHLYLPDVPILLSVCRLDAEKNVDQIIRAFAIAKLKTPMHLVIAGRGSEMDNLQSLAAQFLPRDSYTFAGFVPDEDLPSLYAAANIFVTAGTAELQGITVMEAMATALPIIGVNAMALPELIHDGKNGHLFDPGDTDTLAAHMTTLAAKPELCEQMGLESRRIAEMHEVQKSLKTFEELYRSVQQP